MDSTNTQDQLPTGPADQGSFKPMQQGGQGGQQEALPTGPADAGSFKPSGQGGNSPTGAGVQSDDGITSDDSILDRLKKGTKGFVDRANAFSGGIVESALHTANGVADMVHAPHEAMKQGEAQVHQINQNNPTLSGLGYGGETLLEFLMGDEAIKGLSIGQKLAKSAKIAQVLENSPRLMKALQMGASATKAVGEMTPEQASLLKENPVIARILGAGAEALRHGAVQAGQSFARTQGSVGDRLTQAGEDAALTGGTSAVMGGAAGVVGGTVSKLGKASAKVGELADTAKQATDKETVAKGLAQRIENAKSDLHDRYETAVTGLKDGLGDNKLQIKGSALADKAKELLAAPDPSEHTLVAQAKGAIGDKLDNSVKSLLQNASSGEVEDPEAIAKNSIAREQAQKAPRAKDPDGNPIENEPLVELPETKPAQPMSAHDLVQLRQTVRKMAESYDYGDVNARALRQLLPSIDSSIDGLANQAGNNDAANAYRSIRGEYRDKIGLFDDPVIKSLREGNYDDAARAFIGLKRPNGLPAAGKVRATTETLKGIIGQDGVHEFGKQVFGTMLQDSLEDGHLNASKFVGAWNKINDETKANLFNYNNAANGLKQLMGDAKAASAIQHLTRVGVIAPVAASVPLHGFQALLGLVVADGGGIGRARELVNDIANHPRTWAAYQKAGDIADGTAARSVAPKVGRVAGHLLAQQNQPDYSGAADALSGK